MVLLFNLKCVTGDCTSKADECFLKYTVPIGFHSLLVKVVCANEPGVCGLSLSMINEAY